MNTQTKKFKSSLLQKSCNIGKYELWLDGSTGWGIIFPNGLIEVEEGPHESSGWMFGHINNYSQTLGICILLQDVLNLPLKLSNNVDLSPDENTLL